ncbi:MAG: thioredoxin [Fusobacterium sp.]|uniref:thioredoxin n=1 Tax=Fusobacterium sp. TaxID=68766 RepID=UPI0026DAB841|nr:thioredoxin [Fusobacterium sp.]MDO4691019.1 thioredoxin [Fusobacterium sp.]
MALVKGTKENFKSEVLEAKGLVVVDFGANWCGPCKSLLPILNEVVNEDPNKKIVKVDIDEEEELAKEYKIMSVPTLFVFKNGEVIDKSVGLIQKDEVKALFAK